MPSTGAPSAVPWMPGISILRPRSFTPCARSSIQSLRLSMSSRMPRRRFSAISDRLESAISSTRLRNQLSSSRSLVFSSMGLPSSEMVIEPSACLISRMLPFSSIFALSLSSMTSTIISSTPGTSVSGAGWRKFRPSPGVIGIMAVLVVYPASPSH